jgi:hypothetical protein
MVRRLHPSVTMPVLLSAFGAFGAVVGCKVGGLRWPRMRRGVALGTSSTWPCCVHGFHAI